MVPKPIGIRRDERKDLIVTSKGNTGQGASPALGDAEWAIREVALRGGGRVILAGFKHDNSCAFDVKVGTDGNIDVVSVDEQNGAD